MPDNNADNQEPQQQIEQTSKRIGSIAGKKLQNPATDQDTKALAGSALASRKSVKSKTQKRKS